MSLAFLTIFPVYALIVYKLFSLDDLIPIFCRVVVLFALNIFPIVGIINCYLVLREYQGHCY